MFIRMSSFAVKLIHLVKKNYLSRFQKKNLGFLLSCIMAWTLNIQVAQAQSYVLPEVVVSESHPKTSASQKIIPKIELEMRPNLFVDQLLELVPGLIVIQHAGGGKANQYYLRGFDADHGTDIAFDVEGVPINLVSHAHGQGYTDLHFVIPELLEEIKVRKGPYYAEDGDFATAGAISLRLRKTLERNQLSFQGGRFDTLRALAILGHQGDQEGFYLATEVLGSNGPFQNSEDLSRFNFWGRGNFSWKNWETLLTASVYRSEWNASGQIPVPLVEEGLLDRFGSLDPTEGGKSNRYQFFGDFTWKGSSAQKVKIKPYFYYYDLSLFSNFTFFLNDPINGDQINQRDKREVAGFKSEYSRSDEAGKLGLFTKVGLGLRYDHIHNELNRTRARNFISSTTQNRINQFNPYVYAQEKIVFNDWATLILGARYDHIAMNVDDLLDQGIAGNANGGFFSPKLSAVFSPTQAVNVFLNFGRGFHSNDARGVLNPVDPATIFGKAWGGELGLTGSFLKKVDFSLAGFFLRLGSELVWVGDEGITEPSGATLRTGIETEVRWQILDWLWTSVDFTWTHGEFLDEPNSQNAIPLAPRWTLNGALMARHPSGFYGTLQMEAISDRPANEDRSLIATGFMVWNLAAGYEKKDYQVGNNLLGYALQLDILNLFNASYRSAQFDTTSRPFSTGSEITAVHFTPGWPFTILGSASLFF